MDTIRVIRVIEYVGPREQVEEQVRNSIHGERKVRDMTIRVSTLGVLPEVIYAPCRPEELRAQWEALYSGPSKTLNKSIPISDLLKAERGGKQVVGFDPATGSDQNVILKCEPGGKRAVVSDPDEYRELTATFNEDQLTRDEKLDKFETDLRNIAADDKDPDAARLAKNILGIDPEPIDEDLGT